MKPIKFIKNNRLINCATKNDVVDKWNYYWIWNLKQAPISSKYCVTLNLSNHKKKKKFKNLIMRNLNLVDKTSDFVLKLNIIC